MAACGLGLKPGNKSPSDLYIMRYKKGTHVSISDFMSEFDGCVYFI